MRSKAYLLPGLTMVLRVEGREERSWTYERGMAQYFEFMLAGRELVAPLFTGERYFEQSDIPEVEPGEVIADTRCRREVVGSSQSAVSGARFTHADRRRVWNGPPQKVTVL